EQALRCRIAIVDTGADEGAAQALAEREEGGEILLFRCARDSSSAALNLGALATASEVVALLPGGARGGLRPWLGPAGSSLLQDGRIGAVLDPGSGAVALPRWLLTRLGGLDETFVRGEIATLDLALRIATSGYVTLRSRERGVEPWSEGYSGRDADAERR